MTARSLIGAEIRTLGTGVSEVDSPGTVVFDFGTGNGGDLHLPSQPGFVPGCRVIIIFSGVVSPADSDDISFLIMDGEDKDGRIHGQAPAITDDGVTVGPLGYRSVMFGLQMQAGRPWLRCHMKTTNPAITAVGRAIVLAVPRC